MTFNEYLLLLKNIDNIDSEIEEKYSNAINDLRNFKCENENISQFKAMLDILKSPSKSDYIKFISFLDE